MHEGINERLISRFVMRIITLLTLSSIRDRKRRTKTEIFLVMLDRQVLDLWTVPNSLNHFRFHLLYLPVPSFSVSRRGELASMEASWLCDRESMACLDKESVNDWRHEGLLGWILMGNTARKHRWWQFPRECQSQHMTDLEGSCRSLFLWCLPHRSFIEH